MTNSFKINQCNLSFLTSTKIDWNFSCLDTKTGFNESNVITVFCCQTATLKHLTSEWMDINALVATDYISNIENEFSRWNTYLLFTCVEKIPNSLRYEIENNKFAMRKLVMGNVSELLDDVQQVDVLNKKLLLTEVMLSKKSFKKINPLSFSTMTSSLLETALPPGQTKKNVDDKRKNWLKTQLTVIRQNNAEVAQHKDSSNED